jgi:uncharacterized SAM-binding protein YcdF (DUF218 family)
MSTFESALYTDKMIEAYNIRNLILVTSDYHMPWSYFILRPAYQSQRSKSISSVRLKLI